MIADAITRAFNMGSQARLEGLPMFANPHDTDANEHWAWRRGWEHVDANWGKEVGGRWEFRPLPALRSVA